MRRALLAIGLLIAGGCRTRPLDAAASATGGGGGDMQPGSCMTHSRQAVPLVGLDAISGANIGFAQSVRVLATVALRPCDVPADFTVDVQPGNATDFVTLTAHAWMGSRDCGAAARVARPVELESAAMNVDVAVRDGAPGGTLVLNVSVRAPTSMQCPPIGPGPCEQTCQCLRVSPSARCLPSSGGARCGQPCAEDVECGAGQTCEPTAPGGVQFVCGPPSTGCCAQTCGFGQVCSQTTCACVVTSSPSSGPCRCDGDCAAGTLCSDAGRCLNPCSVLGDCPKPDAASCDRGICSFFVH